MPVFSQIPSSNRVPGVWSEVNNSAANSAVEQLRTLLVGQKFSGGTAASNIAVRVVSQGNANALFGRGSMLARMYALAFANDPNGEIWATPLADDGSAVAATFTMTMVGSTTAAGVFSLYIGGQLVSIAIDTGKTATQQATAIAAAVNSALDLPVTATSSAGVVTFTARNLGYVYNILDFRMNYGGQAAGEALPAGVAVTFANLATGATDPSVATAIANLGDALFDFIALPYADSSATTILGAFQTELAGRWNAMRGVYGHVYSVKSAYGAAGTSATAANLLTFGATRNDPHCSIAGLAKSPTPSWEVCGAFTAAAAASIKTHPAMPTQTLPLVGVLPPAVEDRFLQSDRASQLLDGIATVKVVNGIVQIERDITTYQLDSNGAPDNSYLDSNTPHQLAYGIRYRKARLQAKYGRAVLVASTRGVDPNVNAVVVSPVTLQQEEFAIYDDLCAQAIYQNAAGFRSKFTIAINNTDPTRVDEVNPPYLANQLRQIAAEYLFRLLVGA